MLAEEGPRRRSGQRADGAALRGAVQVDSYHGRQVMDLPARAPDPITEVHILKEHEHVRIQAA